MGNNKYKNWFYGIVTVAVLGFLFGWPIATDPNRPLVKAWNASGIDCLSGHSAIVGAGQHIHQAISITVDGENELIPGNTGIVGACMAELHVHEGETSKIHLESVMADKKFKLSQFFMVYGKPINREGYALKATLNGEILADPANLVLADNQQIALIYTSLKP